MQVSPPPTNPEDVEMASPDGEGESEVVSGDEAEQGKARSTSPYVPPSSPPSPSDDEEPPKPHPRPKKKNQPGDKGGDGVERPAQPGSKKCKTRFEVIEDDVGGGGNSARQAWRPPDLPLFTAPRTQRQLLESIPATSAKSSEDGVKAVFYRAMADQAPLEYEFKAWEKTVSPSNSILMNVIHLSNRQPLSMNS